MITQDGMIAAIRAETESLKARIATLELALHEFLKQTTFGTPVASGLHAVLAAHHATWAEYFRHVLDDFESETVAEPAKCSRDDCNNAAQAEHTCPYKREMNDDDETLCDCCESHTQECCDDI